MALQSRVILLGSVVINAPSVADYHCSIAEHGASIVRLRNLRTLVIDSPVDCEKEHPNLLRTSFGLCSAEALCDSGWNQISSPLLNL